MTTMTLAPARPDGLHKTCWDDSSEACLDLPDEDTVIEVPADELPDEMRCVLCHAGSRTYDAIIAFAAERYGVPAHLATAAEDAYSDIFAFFEGDALVGTITVTRHAVGPIEAAAHYPPAVMTAFGPRIATFYRLAARPGYGRLGLTAMRIACWYSLQQGVRLALFSAKPAMVRWYQRVGFEVLTGVPYVHPRLKSEHVALFCPADPNRHSIFADLCAQVDDHLTVAEVRAVVAD